jgi:hypothetical protein
MTYEEFSPTIQEMAYANGASVKAERIAVYYKRFEGIGFDQWRRVCEHVQLNIKSYKDIASINEIANIVTTLGAWGVNGMQSDHMAYDCSCGHSFTFSRADAERSVGRSIRCPGHFYAMCNKIYDAKFLIKNSVEVR